MGHFAKMVHNATSSSEATRSGSGAHEGDLPPYLFYHTLGEVPDAAALRARMESLEAAHELPGDRVLYLAIPPGAVPEVVRWVGQNGLHRAPGWVRLVVEKPFGSPWRRQRAWRGQCSGSTVGSWQYTRRHTRPRG
jgi:glucose-6-phosphate 1-dehydrogenase